MNQDERSEQENYKLERKKASQVGLLLGGISLAVGAILCLIYILKYKPWKITSFLQP